jgi:indolepyruvate ferredoxin oxidoreductase
MLDAVTLPSGTRDVADWLAADLVDYQNHRYAQRYVDVIGRAATAEAPLGRSDLSGTVAHYLSRLMAYKDEYEVARLHRDQAFADQLGADFPNAKVAYRLHPPLLRAMGLKHKLALPSALINPLFGFLRRIRKVRGTRADMFGYAKVRRVERRLIEDYVTTLEALLPKLTAGNYDVAVEIAAAPEVIRGYEEIKLGRVEEYEAARRQLLERFK